ncbi:hypothetical protein [Maribacter aestuarii]|nr:hypothetical protein [Maribacter aestuarii]
MKTTTIILISIALYMLLLIMLGLYANKRKTSHSLKDFYLAGGNLGPF